MNGLGLAIHLQREFTVALACHLPFHFREFFLVRNHLEKRAERLGRLRAYTVPGIGCLTQELRVG